MDYDRGRWATRVYQEGLFHDVSQFPERVEDGSDPVQERHCAETNASRCAGLRRVTVALARLIDLMLHAQAAIKERPQLEADIRKHLLMRERFVKRVMASCPHSFTRDEYDDGAMLRASIRVRIKQPHHPTPAFWQDYKTDQRFELYFLPHHATSHCDQEERVSENPYLSDEFDCLDPSFEALLRPDHLQVYPCLSTI